MREHPKARFARLLPPTGRVLDIGCWDFSFHRFCQEIGIRGLEHFGVDREPLPDCVKPPGYVFSQIDLESSSLPFPDEFFDGVVSSHVLEHLTRPIEHMDEIFRVLKCGGLLYLECPSTRSLLLPSMPFKLEESRSLSFFDDPTHVGRPHSRQSLYRLFSMYQAEVVECAHLTSRRVRLLSPWLLLRAWLTRDAAVLEHVVWWTVGFALYGIARKTASAQRRYVLRP